MDTELQNVYLSYSVLTIIVQQGRPEFTGSVLSSDTPRDLPDSAVAIEPDGILCSQANEFLHQVNQLFSRLGPECNQRLNFSVLLSAADIWGSP